MTVTVPHELDKSFFYANFGSLVDKTVKIQNLTDLASTVTGFCQQYVSERIAFLEPEAEYIQGQIGKYGLLDLVFVFPDFRGRFEPIDGVEKLKELGFISQKRTSGALTVFPESDCLSDIQREISENNKYLKVMLRIPKFAMHPSPKPLNEILPKDFICLDACITNYSGSWLFKHFYL